MESRISDQTADEAGAWDARLRAPDCTQADRARFAQWRDSHPSHRLAFERSQTIVRTLRSEAGRADVRALREAALRATKRPSWRSRFTVSALESEEHAPNGRGKRTLRREGPAAREGEASQTSRRKLAAAAVAMFAIAVTIWTILPETVRRDPLRELAAVAERISDYALARTYQTGIGQRSTVTLEDGSSVELNAKTRIRVAFNERRRNVELTEGQALFHVAKNAQRPFVVRAGNRDIVAVGTAFDVRLDATTVRVTLIEGKVKVRQQSSSEGRSAHYAHEGEGSAQSAIRGEVLSQERGGEGRAAGSSSLKEEPLPHSLPEIFLTPGQQLIASLSPRRIRGGSYEARIVTEARAHSGAAPEPGVVVRTTDVTKVTGWRDGRVFLEDLALADAVAEMNKYSQVQIRVDDPALTEVRVNGMFRAGEQQAFVTALQDYFPITVRRDGDTEIILAHER